MHRCATLLLPAAVLTLAAGRTNDSVSNVAQAESSVPMLQSTGQAATTIQVVVQGGPHAGKYDAKSPDVTCSYGLTGPGSWGNQYSVTDKKPNEFSSLQLIVPDVKDAADGSDKFLVVVGFGKLGSTEYTINTGVKISGITDGIKPGGSGTVTVDDKGKSGKVTFKGVTQDKVSLEGTINCHQVMRAG